MYKFFPLIVAVFLVTSCSKVGDNILWEKSLGQGEAYFVCEAGDTGILCGGTLSGKSYLVFLDDKRNKLFEYSAGNDVSFTAGLVADGSIIAGGSSGKNLFLASIGSDGITAWDTTLEFRFPVERVSLSRKGPASFLAVGSRSVDTIAPGNYGIAFVTFDLTGKVFERKDTLFYTFYTVTGAASDNEGNIFMAVTRLGAGNKMRASVAKYDERFRQLWERELYNNPEYGASTRAVVTGSNENIFVSGYSEYPVTSGTRRNAFAASVTPSGTVRWKKYLEYNNESSSLIFDRTGLLFVLNSRCMILNLLNPEDGTVTGILRTFASCDPSYDKASGKCITNAYNNIIIIAGSKNGTFYLAGKAPDKLSEI